MSISSKEEERKRKVGRKRFGRGTQWIEALRTHTHTQSHHQKVRNEKKKRESRVEEHLSTIKAD